MLLRVRQNDIDSGEVLPAKILVDIVMSINDMLKLINGGQLLLSFSQNASVAVQHVLFAVKTWSKNHVDRVPIIQRTWARDVKFLRYYSDVSGKCCRRHAQSEREHKCHRFFYRFVAVRFIDTDNKYKCRKYRNRSLHQDVNNF